MKTIFKIKVSEEIPENFPAVIGDAVHNLRSALDHLVWSLVLVNGETPDERTQFPINYSLDSLEKAIPRTLKGVSDKAISAIKQLQPYKGGYGKPGNEILWALFDLDRIDKHRSIVLVGTVHTQTQLRFCVGNPLQKNFQWIGPPIIAANQTLSGPVKDGQTIAEITQSGLLPPEVNLHGSVTFSIRFGEGSAVAGEPIAEVLPVIGQHVQSIIDTFDQRFFG